MFHCLSGRRSQDKGGRVDDISEGENEFSAENTSNALLSFMIFNIFILPYLSFNMISKR